jgi:hypothetical protein
MEDQEEAGAGDVGTYIDRLSSLKKRKKKGDFARHCNTLGCASLD